MSHPLSISPYGTWRSPLSAASVAAGSLRFDHLTRDGDEVYWVETRASEAGRSVLVRLRDGACEDVTAAPFSVRTRVHEYGGAAYLVDRGVVFFSNFADQRIYRLDRGGEPLALTRPGPAFADAQMDGTRGRLICVREEHGSHAGSATNAIVALSCVDGREQVLVEGADFYSDPIVHPDGHLLAWLQWDHPHMPWDETTLHVALFEPGGGVRASVRVAGGPSEAVFQPTWGMSGELYFVSDRSGWWNLYCAPATAIDLVVNDGSSDTDIATLAEPLCSMAAEFGKPQWTFSQTTYCVRPDGRLAVSYAQDGRWQLGLLDAATRILTPLSLDVQPVEGLQALGDDLLFIGGSQTLPTSVLRLSHVTDVIGERARVFAPVASVSADVAPIESESASCTVLRSSTPHVPARAAVSRAESLWFPSGDAQVHAFYYPPHNPSCAAPQGERPPLLVLSHGGPTAAASDVLDVRIQFWTSRGFAVVDVNYGGSTGFGRAYRERLRGNWGVLDVADCVNAARTLVTHGLADPNRLLIRGGSAGGFTTLAALTTTDIFRAGANYYGVSDVEVLARDTHKFEARYLDSLIGPYPAARDLYRERSPLTHIDRLSAALIVFQGLEDKVVPPNQSELIVAAVRQKGLPVAYMPFADEQHGFRNAVNIARSLEAELGFYGAVLGFTPADDIEPVQIDNLGNL